MLNKIIFTIVLFCSTVVNGSEVKEIFQSGSINWSDGTITAVGMGFSKKSNPIIAYKMAQRASKLDAMRNILEMIKHVKVDAKTTVKDKMLENDSINTSISGYINNIVNVKYTKLDSHTVEATIMIKMKDSLTLLVENSDTLNSAIFTGKKATGLIIDASKLNFIPSLNPKLIQEFKGIIYPDNIFQKDSGSNQFVAIYLKNIEDAKKHPLVGAFPIVIQAKELYNNMNDQIVLNKENSNKIINELKKEALQNGKVIILLK